MKFTEDTLTAQLVIESYDADSVSINGRQYRQSLLLSGEGVLDKWAIGTVQDLRASHLQPLLDTQPEVILIGTGLKLVFPAMENYGEVMNQGVGVEFMDTGAACRTYNILVGEGRRVCAGLILQAGQGD